MPSWANHDIPPPSVLIYIYDNQVITWKRSGLKYYENLTKHIDRHLVKTRVLLNLTFFAQTLSSEIYIYFFVFFFSYLKDLHKKDGRGEGGEKLKSTSAQQYTSSEPTGFHSHGCVTGMKTCGFRRRSIQCCLHTASQTCI